MSDDDKIMPYVDMTSIACGFHAGDPVVMQRAIRFAKVNKVSIGAHPSYPDLQGFGRRSMKMSASEMVALIQYQVAALEGMAKCQGMSLDYIKPHGAMYNDMMADESVMNAVFEAVKDFHRPLPLVVQATPSWQFHQDLANNMNLTLLFEAFADRRYQDDGRLTPRSEPGAVLDGKQLFEQVKQLMEQQHVVTVSGKRLSIKADTLCLHGDNPEVVATIEKIHHYLASFNT